MSSFFIPDEKLIKVEQIGSVRIPSTVKFYCSGCNTFCFGFDDVYGKYLSEDSFHCPCCGAAWSDLEPVYYMIMTIKNDFSDKTQTAEAVGSVMDLVMGMTVQQYLGLAKVNGIDSLMKITNRYFASSYFRVIISGGRAKIKSFRPRKDNSLTFYHWIKQQNIYNTPEAIDVLNEPICEDDGFVGTDE